MVRRTLATNTGWLKSEKEAINMGKKSRQKMTGLDEIGRMQRKIERSKKLIELMELIKEKLKDPQARAELIAAIEASKGRMTKEQLLKALGEMKGESAKT